MNPSEYESVSFDEDRETYYLNMGPQHPSMHGVLRLVLKMRGEEILEAEPVIGYAHRAHEKMAENRNYMMFLPNTSRVDYLCGMIYNLGYCQALEKVMGIEVPERVQMEPQAPRKVAVAAIGHGVGEEAPSSGQ